MAAETQYTAKTGRVTILAANANLDGVTGTYYDVITGATGGTLVKTVTIKAQSSTTEGMVRLFYYNGTNTRIVAEIPIPAMTISPTDPAFETTVPVNLVLKLNDKLKASSQNYDGDTPADVFNVIAAGLDWAYYGSVRPESTKYTSNMQTNTLTAANSTMTAGSGTVYQVMLAAANGTIQSIVLKGQTNTTAGMVRIFIQENVSPFAYWLFMEIPVSAMTKSATVRTFSHRIDFGGKDFALQSGFSLQATSEKGESINTIAECLDWAYPA